MIENLVVFTLGALVALLVVLLIAPTLFRRTARLAERRVRATAPLTMAEIRAEQDLIRADHAVALRKVEIQLDRLKRAAVAGQIELGRREAEVRELQTELQDRRQLVEELENRIEDMSSTILALEKHIAEQTVALKEKQQAISVANDNFRAKAAELEEARAAGQAAREEIASLKRALETAEGRVGELRAALATKSVESEGNASEVDELTGILKQRDRLISALKRRVSRRRDLSRERRRRAMELAGLLAAQRERVAEKTSALSAAELKRMQLEEEIARLGRERSELKSRIADLEAKLEYRDRELARLKVKDGGEATAARAAAQAQLRDNINDLAARITRLAMQSGNEGIRTMVETGAEPLQETEAPGGGKGPSRRGRTTAGRVPVATRVKEADLTPGE
ncbi:hypothetical protein EDC22_101258 [Tepidamorphus gemmatus]|uniref:Chromosome segregation ATPase n=1 Tax=Tepidamorphus gemmatus TaxID=747076 RepID=A0A4R3MJ81_9HYPH|nr:hypothetical protein [Tepidamorphus gemmatus]TCT13393.1 hypothetical protein EDC22_101258 [Tepidamorphus gemmatus]